jgi:two-component SAPR family response regulator
MDRKPKILVLEDDPKMLEVLVDVLREHDYDVTPTSNGEEAVAKAMEQSFDLIVADIRMEGMNGLDAVEQSRREQPEMGTLIVSGYATPDNMARAMKLQAGKILSKPFKIKEFLSRIEEQLAHRQKHQAKRSRADRSEGELQWALNALAHAIDRPAPEVPSRYYRVLAEGMARTAELSEQVCLEVGLAAALAADPHLVVPSEVLEHTTTLSTLKFCLAHYEEPTEASSRLEVRIVGFALSVVGDDWDSHNPPSPSSLAEQEVAPDMLELYQKYLDGGSGRQERRSEQEQMRSALSLAHTLHELGRTAEARKAFEQLRAGSDGRLLITALLGQAQLELSEGNPEAVVRLAVESVEKARSFGPVSYATTLLAAGLFVYQVGQDSSRLLKEAVQELGRLRFDGSVALAAIALSDLGHQPNPEKLNYFLAALVKPRYSEEVMGAAGWLVPACLKLLIRAENEDSVRAVVRLLSRLAPSVLAHFRSDLASVEEKRAFLAALESNSGLVPSMLLDELVLDQNAEVARAASTLQSAQSTVSDVPVIRCRSFGVFQVFRGAEAVPDKDWKTKKVRYYFAYLASQWGSYQADDVIIEEFWPNKPKDKGKQNLYWATSILRKCVGGDEESLKNLLERREESLRLNPEVLYWHDLQEFESMLDSGKKAIRARDWSKARHFLSQMAELCTGPYLEGYRQGWAEQKRAQISLRHQEGLKNLAQCCLELEDYSGALEAARRLLEIDPSVETGHEYAMRAFLGDGNYTRAIQQFEQCHKILSDEYGLEPSPEMQSLYEEAFAYGDS